MDSHVRAVVFVLAVLALTPVADSAKILFAANADKVDGVHASKTAKAGALLPLGKDAKVPCVVAPKAIGPRGPAGATGAYRSRWDTRPEGRHRPAGTEGRQGCYGRPLWREGPEREARSAGCSGPEPRLVQGTRSCRRPCAYGGFELENPNFPVVRYIALGQTPPAACPGSIHAVRRPCPATSACTRRSPRTSIPMTSRCSTRTTTTSERRRFGASRHRDQLDRRPLVLRCRARGGL